MTSHSSSPPMLEIQATEDQYSPPAVDHNTTKSPVASPEKSNGSVKNSPMGPVVVFIARASDLSDHNYPGTVLNTIQMHAYLRGLLVIMSAEHRKVYGNLGSRPQKIQTVIHPANSKMSISCRTTKFLAGAMEEARDTKSECIFVLNNWDAWTTDIPTVAEMCEKFTEVPFTLRVWANGHGIAREFYEANAHKAINVLRQRMDIKDERVTSDRNTALFVRMFEALHRAHDLFPPTLKDRQDLAKYDSRLA
ncbi:hypothetical protein N7541_007430 [Penicillium brevicompactum]|uniref:Uncharacterized protein n=1 Tax=Penicillium brevicompactum TaxID=5074 RepID=A0A9W9ULP7_PENBR|nr:hypothetical protein N7541_007430 [Penicillium brevicompactum]